MAAAAGLLQGLWKSCSPDRNSMPSPASPTRQRRLVDLQDDRFRTQARVRWCKRTARPLRRALRMRIAWFTSSWMTNWRNEARKAALAENQRDQYSTCPRLQAKASAAAKAELLEGDQATGGRLRCSGSNSEGRSAGLSNCAGIGGSDNATSAQGTPGAHARWHVPQSLHANPDFESLGDEGGDPWCCPCPSWPE
jgi:hypothetical protein